MAVAYGNMNFKDGHGAGGNHDGADSLKNAFASNVDFTNYTFSELTKETIRNSSIAAVDLPGTVRETLTHIKNLWNLDRGETARRVYIDAWVTSAIVAVRDGTVIITAEEFFELSIQPPAGAPQRGTGRMDYLICEMALTVGGVVPVYAPSLIIEAKAKLHNNPYNGVGQLVAEIDTVRDEAGYNNPLRGIVTDGRYWRFVEVDPNTNYVYFTDRYDTGAPDNWNADPPVWNDTRRVWGLIRHFFSTVRNTNRQLPG